MTSGPVIKVSV